MSPQLDQIKLDHRDVYMNRVDKKLSGRLMVHFTELVAWLLLHRPWAKGFHSEFDYLTNTCPIFVYNSSISRLRYLMMSSYLSFYFQIRTSVPQ